MVVGCQTDIILYLNHPSFQIKENEKTSLRNDMPTPSGKVAEHDTEYTPFRYLCRHNTI